MASYTNNLKLIKPSDGDSYNIKVDNDNMDILDDKISILQTLFDNNLEVVSNSNGTALKFANGIMICYQKFAATVSAWSAWGGVYAGVISPQPPSFPVPFTSTPAITYGIETGGMNGWVATRGEAGNATATAPGPIQIVRGSSASGTASYSVSTIAIGRWK